MTDALNARLAGVSALRVISQTSSLVYRGTHKPLSQIARELNVNGIVEGSVLRSGDRIRINVQLVQPATEKRIWGQTYEHDVQDVLALQSEVTRAIVNEIQAKLTPRKSSGSPRCTHPIPMRTSPTPKAASSGTKEPTRACERRSIISRRRSRKTLLMRLLTWDWRTHGCPGPGTRIYRRRKPFPTPGRQSEKRWNSTPIWRRRTPPSPSSSSTTSGTGPPPIVSFCGPLN